MSRFRFFVRFLALTALFLAGVGALICAASLSDVRVSTLKEALDGRHGQMVQIALWVVVGGAAGAAVVFLIDTLVGIGTSAGRRSVLGFNVIVQVALAVVLLVGVNVWSFQNYRRWDVTRDQRFTIDPRIAAELRKLSGNTTIVVYLQHASAGRLSGKPDRYDIAAEQKVVEKVHDLVDQLREFGSQFNVVVLDVEDREYNRKLEQVTQECPGLDSVIKATPENTIFFCGGKHIQRMSFDEFYRLDKAASMEANGGRGNLVLLYQGIEPFARRILSIEEKRPRVGVAVIHEVLTTQSTEDAFTMAGIRKSLTENGYEVVDILLKRWGEDGPKPATYTFEENRLEQLEEELAELNYYIPATEADRKRYEQTVKTLKEKTLDELNYDLRDQLPTGRTFTEEDRQLNLNRFEAMVNALGTELQQLREAQQKAETELAVLTKRESVVEGRRVTDLKAKSRRLLDDIDLLILPRHTIISLLSGTQIPPRVYRLDQSQVAAIKDFIRAGKPVFAMFGPTNQPANIGFDSNEPDELEALFRDLGIVFGDQTIIYNVESRAFAERRVSPLGGVRAPDPPPLDFEATGAIGLADASVPPNRLRESLRLVARSSGQKLDLLLRHPRPVYYVSLRGEAKEQAEFLMTDAAAWNEAKPFPDRTYTPRFDAKSTDPTKVARDDERRGPFPIGVAVETTVPPVVMNDKYRTFDAAALVLAGSSPVTLGSLLVESATPIDPYTKTDPTYKPVTVRVAAIGHGGVFISADASNPKLPPAREQLLLQTVNWLLGRDDRLAKSEQVWQYPRVELSRQAEIAWIGGAWLGLPALFIYIGGLVLMARRIR